MRKHIALAAVLALISSSVQAAYQGTSPDIVANGGTGAVTLTDHGVLLGHGTSPITATTVGTNGQMFLGATGADPGWQTMSGDATLGTTGALTLATVNANVGSFTNASITVNGKGVITAASSGSAGASPTYVSVATATPITLASTNLLTSVINTTGGGVINLPTAAQNLRTCVKDGTALFGSNAWTVKATGTIDGVAGATGIVMSQNRQERCFASYDGTNWIIE